MRNNFITFHPTFFFLFPQTLSICQQHSKILLSKYTSIFLPHTRKKKSKTTTKHPDTKTTRTQQKFKYLGRNPTGFSQGTGRAVFQGQQPGTAQVNTQEGFPPAVAKDRLSGLCSTCKSTCPCSELPSEAPAAYSTHSNCCASCELQGWGKEAETGMGEVGCRMKVGIFPSVKMTDALLCSTPPCASPER